MALTVGQVASRAKVNVETIRYYEQRAVLPIPRRAASGYRQYDEETVRRLRFIRHAQELGFTLQEIKELLSLRIRHGASCHAVERRASQKVSLVVRRIGDLRRIQRTLERLVAACAVRQASNECPILEALEDRAISS